MIQWDKELYHYGIPRRSGRYKWGSGKDPYHHGESIPKKIKKAYAKTALSVTKVSSKPIGAGLQTAVAVGNAAGKAQQTARNGISKGVGAVNKARDDHKAKIESMTPEERKARRDRNIKIAAGLGITLASAYTAKKLYDNQELRDVINNYKTIQREMPPQSSKAAAARRQLLRTGIKDSIGDDRQRIRNERKEFVNSAARKASESVRSKIPKVRNSVPEGVKAPRKLGFSEKSLDRSDAEYARARSKLNAAELELMNYNRGQFYGRSTRGYAMGAQRYNPVYANASGVKRIKDGTSSTTKKAASYSKMLYRQPGVIRNKASKDELVSKYHKAKQDESAAFLRTQANARRYDANERARKDPYAVNPTMRGRVYGGKKVNRLNQSNDVRRTSVDRIDIPRATVQRAEVHRANVNVNPHIKTRKRRK